MDCENSKSTGGYVIELFVDSVAWRSHKQTLVCTSTCQAEYLAMSENCQEIISLDKAIRDIIGKTMFPADIWCDNLSALACTQMEGNHKLKSFNDDLEEIQKKLDERQIEKVICHLSMETS